jgi:hypothetical protein
LNPLKIFEAYPEERQGLEENLEAFARISASDEQSEKCIQKMKA